MDIHSITIEQEEVDRELAHATPIAPAGSLKEDGCSAYRRVKPALEVATAILGWAYPPGATALATVMVILNKACERGE